MEFKSTVDMLIYEILTICLDRVNQVLKNYTEFPDGYFEVTNSYKMWLFMILFV